MENRIIYEIIEVKDLEGKIKEIPSKWYQNYSIYLLKQGMSAILIGDNDTTLQTSTVEDLIVTQNIITIRTKNTVYTLQAHIIQA